MTSSQAGDTAVGKARDVRFAGAGDKPIASVILIEQANNGRPTGRQPMEKNDTSKWRVKAAEAGGLLFQHGAPPVKAAATSAESPAPSPADKTELKLVSSTDAARHTVGCIYYKGGVVHAQDRLNK
jgi:hypothetical protein